MIVELTDRDLKDFILYNMHRASKTDDGTGVITTTYVDNETFKGNRYYHYGTGGEILAAKTPPKGSGETYTAITILPPFFDSGALSVDVEFFEGGELTGGIDEPVENFNRNYINNNVLQPVSAPVETIPGDRIDLKPVEKKDTAIGTDALFLKPDTWYYFKFSNALEHYKISWIEKEVLNV